MTTPEAKVADEAAGMQCEKRRDISRGFLETEERVNWRAPLPASSVLICLPARMDALHFAAVRRSVGGLMRCDVRADRVACRLLGVWPALLFDDARTEMSERKIEHSWRISGGFLARRAEGGFGRLTFGWEADDGTGSVRQSLWVSVSGYPSRFLPLPESPSHIGLRRAVAGLYSGYHSVVACRFLRRLAQWMLTSEKEQTNA